MIDIHCHILPEIDDGPHDIEISVKMASIAAHDGIRTIIATPHTDGIRVGREKVTAKVDELNRRLAEESIPLEILAGYELPYHLVAELAATHTLAASKYVLLEFPHAYVPFDAASTIYNLAGQGLQPIIAHPERNGSVMARPDILMDLVDAGGLCQLTASSITGEMGPDPQRCAYYLLNNGLAHFIATDSHSPHFRAPILTKAHAMATRLLNRQQADRLTKSNPARITESG